MFRDKINTSPRRWLVSAVATVTAAGAMTAALTMGTSTASAAVTPSAVPAPPAGFTTVFSDDFNGGAGSAPSGTWIHDTGTGVFGTGEIETMTNSTANTHLDGAGDLQITANGSGNSWTSGRIHTNGAIVGAPAGGQLEVTASIQQPNPGNGLGYWPAFWMLGPGQWPGTGEIDILENVNALNEHSGTVHCGVTPGGPCNEQNGIGSGLVGCGCITGFHTYTMIEDRRSADETISWFLDGNQFFSVDENRIGASTWQAAFDHNLMIIFDLAMGGAFPNGVCGCTSPSSGTTSGGTMTVQYVAAYTSTGGGGNPPPNGRQLTGIGGKCVDVAGANNTNGTQVQLFTCNGTAAQSWTHSGSSYQALGKCLDVNAAGTANGTKVQLWDCNGTGAQQWTHTASNQLVNTNSGRCLDATGNSSADSTPLQIWDCSGGANQAWAGP
jgi:hypothetical protein